MGRDYPGQQIDPVGAFEHADRDQHRNKERNDLKNPPKPFLPPSTNSS